jgi:hypothetical protein
MAGYNWGKTLFIYSFQTPLMLLSPFSVCLSRFKDKKNAALVMDGTSFF